MYSGYSGFLCHSFNARSTLLRAHAAPMQIDTRNREHGVSPADVHNCTNMTECAGYEPRQARYGRNWGGRSKSRVATENLRENADGARHQRSLRAVPCYFRFMLTRALY